MLDVQLGLDDWVPHRVFQSGPWILIGWIRRNFSHLKSTPSISDPMDRTAYQFGEPRSNPDLRYLIGRSVMTNTPSPSQLTNESLGFIDKSAVLRGGG
jgi:hypothetical protein